jgi:hypothetical protein
MPTETERIRGLMIRQAQERLARALERRGVAPLQADAIALTGKYETFGDETILDFASVRAISNNSVSVDALAEHLAKALPTSEVSDTDSGAAAARAAGKAAADSVKAQAAMTKNLAFT